MICIIFFSMLRVELYGGRKRRGLESVLGQVVAVNADESVEFFENKRRMLQVLLLEGS